MEVAFAGDDLGAAVRHALHLVRPLPRRLERGLDRLEPGVDRQRPVHAGQAAEPLEERRQPVVVVGAGGHRQALRLLGERADDPRVAVAEAHRGVGRHHVEVAASGLVPDVDALAAREHDRQRVVVRRAVAPFDFDHRARGAAAQHRGSELLDEPRGRAAAVAMRLVLDDLDRDRRCRLGERRELRQEGGGAQAAGHRGRDAGRVLRVDRVEVERDAVGGGALPHARERLAEHLREAAALDLRDRVDPHAERGGERRLLGLEAPHADHADVLGRERGARLAERIAGLAEQRRERHAVELAAVARLGRVRVEVGVDPEQPELAFHRVRHAAPGSHRDAVVAAEHERNRAVADDLRRRAGEPLAQAADDLRHRFARGLVGEERLAPGGGDAARDEVRVEAGEPQARRAVAAAGVGGAEAARCADDLHAACAGGRRLWRGAEEVVGSVHARLECKTRTRVRFP